MDTLQAPRWLAAQASVIAAVLVAGVVAALTLHVPVAVPSDTLRLVSNAAGAAEAAGSYRMELDMAMKGGGLDVKVTGTADLVAETGEGSGEIELPDGGVLRFLVTQERGWFQLPETSALRMGGKEWVGFPAEDAAVTEDPLSFLELLAQDGQVLDLGEDEVRGVATRHYRSELDPEALMTLAQQQQGSTLLNADLARLVEDARAEVWLDEAGLPRRVRMQLEAQSVKATFSFELFEFGVPVTVTPPPAETVIDVESQLEASRLLMVR